MIINNLKVAFRSISKQKFYGFINILGLTTGIIATLLIIIYINDELSYDKFHKDAERIHRVTLSGVLAGQAFDDANTCAPLAAALVEEFPEVDESLRLNLWTDVIVRYGDDAYTEKNLLLADSNFFNFFSFELLQGDPNYVLKEPNSVVLSEDAARKYFGYSGPGDNSPIGKEMQLVNNDWNFKVTGIAANPPSNSHFTFDMIMSMDSWEYSREQNWTSNSFHTYVKYKPGTDINKSEEKLYSLVEKYVGPEIEQYLGFNLEKFIKEGGRYGYGLQPLTDIHLYSHYESELGPNGDIVYIYIFSLIGLFIISIACINFMNLSTARSANRAKEVGVRKSIGAHRGGLIRQFLTESFMFSIISTILALISMWLIIPLFNQLSNKHFVFWDLLNIKIAAGIILLTLFIGLLAGSYPAFYLTSFKPAEVLKGKIRAGFKAGLIRSTLVVFQFTISIALIISTVFIYRQLNMIQQQNLGFDQENVIVIRNGSKLDNNRKVFHDELEKYEDILSVSTSTSLPPEITNNSVFRPKGGDVQDLLFYTYRADFDHAKTLGLEMKDGRFFSPEFAADSNALVINETALKMIGWKSYENQSILSYNHSDGPEGVLMPVIGVIKDFNFESLKSDISPLIISYSNWGNQVTIRIAPGDVERSIDKIKNTWRDLSNNAPFEYSFMDEKINRLYDSEQRLSRLFVIFTGLAIFIACLGLLGLATFTAEQRSKELGIRKVLGATLGNLVVLISKEFTRLVLISFVLAVPLAYLFVSNWLDNFAYKTSINVVTFIIGGLISLLMAWLTVSYHSIKAARSNPVDSLKSE